MLKYRLISADADLEKYVNMYQKLGMHTSVSALRCSDVYVFFHKNGPEEWLAGFTITTDGSMRYLDLMPADQRLAVETQFGITKENLVEVGGLFMKTIRLSRMERVQVYAQMLWAIHRTGKKILVAGSFLSKERAKQMRIFPEVIYNGPINYHGKTRNIWIYLGTSKGLVGRSVLGILKEIRPDWQNIFRFPKKPGKLWNPPVTP